MLALPILFCEFYRLLMELNGMHSLLIIGGAMTR
jgi:hypothetical protein